MNLHESISSSVACSSLSATALTIAGSDPSGGAGLQADLKTFQQMGIYGMTVISLLTVQNTLGVSRVHMVELELVAQQIEAVLSDIVPKVIKVGALGTRDMVSLVADKLRSVRLPIVVDPVMVSKHGSPLVADDFLDCFRKSLLPLATIVTPNRFEAEKLVGFPIVTCGDARKAAEQLAADFGCAVLVKLGREQNDYVNVLSWQSKLEEIRSPFHSSNNTHGTGCVLSAMIAGELALGHSDIPKIVRRAVNYLSEALESRHGLGQGGIHPLETRLLQPPKTY